MDRCDILIFDDDEHMVRMLEDIAEQAGYTRKSYPDGKNALDAVRRLRPRLVVLDVMMPGLDGLTLCRMIRADPYLREARILILTTKQSQTDELRAAKFGADAFMRKPADVVELAGTLQRLAGAPGGHVPAAPSVVVGLWGARSGPVAGASEFGTRTSCVSIAAATGERIVLDAGTGLGPCLGSLFSAGWPGELVVLLTHYHAGHVEGLAELSRLAPPGAGVRVAGPTDPEVSLRALLAGRGCSPGEGRAAFTAALLSEETYSLGPNARLSALYCNHPATTLGFAVTAGERKIVYCPDNEVTERPGAASQAFEQKLRDFCRGADLLIHDAALSPEDYARAKGAGHSSWRGALRLAQEAAARKLLFFHLDAAYPDARLRELEAEAQAEAGSLGVALECRVAREGSLLSI